MDQLVARDPDGSRVALAVRSAFDDVLDGPRTGRYRVSELHKQEKAYPHLVMERALARAFDLRHGDSDSGMDLLLADDTGTDLKFSLVFGGWMFSKQHIGKLVLLLHADDETNRWSLGALRIQEGMLAQGGNPDGKRRLAADHRHEIQWIQRDASLPPNALADLPPDDLREILKQTSGKRVTELLRKADGLVISRNNLETVAMQQDVGRRVREARSELAASGIVLLSGGNLRHERIARSLALPVPSPGEYVTARLARVQPGHESMRNGVVPDDEGECWALALPDDVPKPLPLSLRLLPSPV
ncbi:NaeI family type II restriction endonuclease [Streptomyces maoxianensis]|uniref:NaeI family type II restriction endonuclease n=1 Tax=Streptomyces maoxianensis TaxID=1459942 RepID=A0ABV9G3Y3_9ACTN